VTDAPEAIRFESVTKRFGGTVAVDGLDIQVRQGEFFSLLGPSGCGKTTTLRMVAGFEQPSEGRIFLEGEPVDEVPPYHRNVNTVFQSYALFEHLDVKDNVAFGLKRRKVESGEIRERVAEALELVQLTGREKSKPHELSGGQKQRVALARALVNRPAVLLLDEPLGALDLKLRKEMQLELKALQREVGITFVYVTHDQEEALTMSDVIVVMRDGRIQQQGGPTELYEQPVNRFVADFIGSSNFLPGTIAEFDSANRIATVRTDGGLTIRGRVTDAVATPGPGDVVTVAARPERLEAVPADGPSPNIDGWTSVPGRIHQGTYLGDQTEFRVQTDLAGELVVRRQNATGTGTSQGMGPGDPVVVRWLDAANLVLLA
jgi:spermidine/putrescine transport system ATP-binding protein